MKFLQVNYERSISKSDADQAERMAAAARKIAQIPGLHWKIWVYDEDARVAGGMYLFDSEDSARGWGEGPMEASLSAHPGIGNITKRYFDVDEELSQLTHGPVPERKEAANGN